MALPTLRSKTDGSPGRAYWGTGKLWGAGGCRGGGRDSELELPDGRARDRGVSRYLGTPTWMLDAGCWMVDGGWWMVGDGRGGPARVAGREFTRPKIGEASLQNKQWDLTTNQVEGKAIFHRPTRNLSELRSFSNTDVHQPCSPPNSLSRLPFWPKQKPSHAGRLRNDSDGPP